MNRLRLLLAILISLTLLTAAPSNAAVKAGAKCTKAGATSTVNGKKFTCIKVGNKLVWNKGVTTKAGAKPNINPVLKPADPVPTPTPTPTPSATPTPTPTPQVPLPTEGTICPNVGVKISNSSGFMKCIWQGGLINGALTPYVWRYYSNIKLSTSKSNNYTSTPKENTTCTNSGDTFDVVGGILECRWVSGRKLQWIKVNTIKATFSNAKSPVSLDICRLQNSASSIFKGGSGQEVAGFPLINSGDHRMNLKGTNEVLIVPIDFSDFPGGNEVVAQLTNDKMWITDWYQYFSNGQSKFNITTFPGWLRMPKERSAYPSDAKLFDARGRLTGIDNSNRRMADQAQVFIDEITKQFDLRKFSTVYFFYPDGEFTFTSFIVRNQWFKIKEGEVQLNLFSGDKQNEAMQTLLWSYHIHETLHDFRTPLHAPGNGWPIGMGSNQSGISLAQNPWEQFQYGWLPEEQIYCDDLATLKTATISLSPVEREDRQTKMAVIRLSPTKAVVVESHGIDKWSLVNAVYDREFPPGFYSIMAYVVDLDKVGSAPVNDDATSRSNDDWAWAVFQKVQGGSSNQFNINVGDRKNLSDYVAVLGDSFLIEGVRIKFVGTGDFETIEISKG